MNQQEWASQYVSWDFPATTKEDVWNIDQQVWVPRPNEFSFWPFQWTWSELDFGGYLGLQQCGEGVQQARFSLWNALEAQGPNQNEQFGGEGLGCTSTMRLEIDPNRFYVLRLWKMEKESDGQWWSGWLMNSSDDGSVVEHLIGRIKAPTGCEFASVSSITNFVEYWGPQKSHCANVPTSSVAFAQPAINSIGNGQHQCLATFRESTKSEKNLCSTGREQCGALISAKPIALGTIAGVMMNLGGHPEDHVGIQCPQPPSLIDLQKPSRG